MPSERIAGFVAWWPNDGETIDDAASIEMDSWQQSASDKYRYAAEEAAECDWTTRDGWERSEGEHEVAVQAVDEAGEPIGPPQVFLVTREVEYSFHASRKVEEAPNAE